MFLMIKSLTISLFTKGDCKSTYIDLYRCSKDLCQPFEVYLVPMCFKEIPEVRYSGLKDSWKGHVNKREGESFRHIISPPFQARHYRMVL